MKYLTLIGFPNIKFYFIEFIPANVDAAQGPECHPEKQEAEESSQPRLPSQSGCAAEKARWECQLPVGTKGDSSSAEQDNAKLQALRSPSYHLQERRPPRSLQ